MIGFDAIAGGAIADLPAGLNVQGFLAVTFGTPEPFVNHDFHGFYVLGFGTPNIPQDSTPEVTGVNVVIFGTPAVLRFNGGIRQTRVHLSGVLAPKFGTPTLP